MFLDQRAAVLETLFTSRLPLDSYAPSSVDCESTVMVT